MNLDSDQIEPPDIGSQTFSISLLYIAKIKACLLGRDVHREVGGKQERKRLEAINATSRQVAEPRLGYALQHGRKAATPCGIIQPL